MSFVDSIHHMTTKQFFGSSMLVFPTHISYLLYRVISVVVSHEIETFVRYYNMVLFGVFLYLTTRNISKINIVTLFMILITRKEGTSPFNIVNMVRNLPDNLPVLNNRIFGAITLILMDRSCNFLTMTLAILSDHGNHLFVFYYLVSKQSKKFYRNFLRRKSNRRVVVKAIMHCLIMLIAVFGVNYLDVFFLRNRYSTTVEKYHIELRNRYMGDQSDKFNTLLLPTHKYVLDRNEISLLGLRHRNHIKNLTIEKVHKSDEVTEEDRFIRENEEIKLQRTKDGETQWLVRTEEGDDKFQFTKWDKENDEDKTIFLIRNIKLREIGNKQGSQNAIPAYLTARTTFEIVHKQSGHRLCVKFDQNLYTSTAARFSSCEFMIDENETHPYYLKHFKDGRVQERISKYNQAPGNIWVGRRSVRLIRDLSIYFNQIRPYYWSSITREQKIFLGVGIYSIFHWTVIWILNAKYSIVKGLPTITRQIMCLITIAVTGCNIYSFVYIFYGFLIELNGLVIKRIFNRSAVVLQEKKSE